MLLISQCIARCNLKIYLERATASKIKDKTYTATEFFVLKKGIKRVNISSREYVKKGVKTIAIELCFKN